MTKEKEKKDKDAKEKKRASERRNMEKFAWLGPMMERRKAEVELVEDQDKEEELEEIEDKSSDS